MKHARVAAGALLVLSLAGCSASPSAAHTAKPTPVHFAIGASASRVAAAIKACTDVQAQQIGKGGPALVSTATCHIQGHLVNINSWQSDGEAAVQPVLDSNGYEAYFAAGDSWTVTMGDDETLQMQLTNDSGDLFTKALNGETPAPGDVDGEKTVAEMVVKSIGGSVVHIAGK